jgi:hypothetical protein
MTKKNIVCIFFWPVTPYERNQAHALRSIVVMFTCVLLTATLVPVLTTKQVLDEKNSFLVPLILIGVVGIPYALVSMLKRRCPRCGALLLGEGNPQQQAVKSWKIPKTCFACDLDQTVEYKQDSNWKQWS